LSVKVVGPTSSGAACAPLVAQLIENQLSALKTGSLKVMVMSELTGTLVAPLAGEVEVTVGALSETTKDWPVLTAFFVFAFVVFVTAQVKSP
jgi:hypothetical protein